MELTTSCLRRQNDGDDGCYHSSGNIQGKSGHVVNSGVGIDECSGGRGLRRQLRHARATAGHQVSRCSAPASPMPQMGAMVIGVGRPDVSRGWPAPAFARTAVASQKPSGEQGRGMRAIGGGSEMELSEGIRIGIITAGARGLK